MLKENNPARPPRSMWSSLLDTPKAKSEQGETALSHYEAER